MNQPVKRVGVLIKHGETRIASTLDALVATLVSHKVDILVPDDTDASLPAQSIEKCPREMLADKVDLIIVVGGDGTMLQAAHLTKEKTIPLVGINAGRLGFLADIPGNKLAPMLERILTGHCIEEHRFPLSADILRNGKSVYSDMALNDVVLQKSEGGRMIEFDSFINDSFVCAHRADGIIVSTPTGSTAYALSGGGPILHPGLSALVLVPICPHTLSDRPIVIDNSSCIDLCLTRDAGSPAQLVFDGQRISEVKTGDKVRIRRSEQFVTLLHPDDHDYFKLLRNKLRWGHDKEDNIDR
ncbi:MAG: NAD(+) kinase [Gammaproteobacteria bacterium]